MTTHPKLALHRPLQARRFNLLAGCRGLGWVLAWALLLCSVTTGLKAQINPQTKLVPTPISTPIDTRLPRINLENASHLLEDPDGKLSLADVRAPENARRFEHKLPHIGFSASAWWLHFSLRANDATVMWLNTGNRTLQEIDVYVADANGQFQHQLASANLVFSARPLPTSYFVFPVSLLPQTNTEIYLRVRSTGFLGVIVAPELWQPAAYKKMEKREKTQWLIYMGMVSALGLFNLMLCISIKQSYYLLYTVVVVSIAWAICSAVGGFGATYEYLWPNSPHFEQAAWILAFFAAASWPIQFVFKFTNFAASMPRMYVFLQRCQLLLAFLVLIQAIGTIPGLPNLGWFLQKTHILGSAVFTLLFPGTIFSLCFLAWRGNRQAKFLAIAWLPVLFFGTVWALYRFSGQKYNVEVTMWSSAFELVLMSLALADRFNQEKKAKERAQAAGVEILRRSEQELEDKVAVRTQELRQEQIQTKRLLHNILPVEIANELSETGSASSARHESVTILFTDFIGFTQAVAQMSADQMVAELNEIFAAFDDITDACGVEKIKTIGDAYMAVAGLPKPCDDHAQRCVRAALRMVAYLEQRNANSPFQWLLRIGIHSGPVVAGVVGKRKFAFDIWGDTVNIAARMESAGENGRVNVSAYTCDLIRAEFPCQYRGKLNAKGKGQVDMYFVGNAPSA